jgi:hypothetical protein
MKYYSLDEILKAAQIGEVSMIDANHFVSLLEEARSELAKCQPQVIPYYRPIHELIQEVAGHFDTTPEAVIQYENREPERYARMTIAMILFEAGLTRYQIGEYLHRKRTAIDNLLRKHRNEAETNKFYRSYWYLVRNKS